MQPQSDDLEAGTAVARRRHHTLPTGQRNRAPPTKAQHATEWLKSIAAPSSIAGGQRGFLGACLRGGDDDATHLEVLLGGLHGEAAEALRTVLLHWRPKLLQRIATAEAEAGQMTAAERMAVYADKADDLITQWRRTEGTAVKKAVLSGGSGTRDAGRSSSKPTPPLREYTVPMVELHVEALRKEPDQVVISRHWPEVVPITTTLREIVGPPGATYVPDDSQQRDQLTKVVSWDLGRAVTEESPVAVFTMGAMSKAIREQPGGGRPMLKTIRAQLHFDKTPTATASGAGHLWGVWRVATTAGRSRVVTQPLDAAQYARVFGVPWAEAALSSLVTDGVVKAAVFRELMGQGTHGASVAAVVERLMSHIPIDVMQPGKLGRTVASIGAGVGLTGFQIAQCIRGTVTVMVDNWEVARKAGSHLARQLQGTHQPTQFSAADGMEFARDGQRCLIDAVTMQCAPFSQAGKDDFNERMGAVEDLRATMGAVARRRPMGILVENTSGLLGLPEWRARVEGVLNSLVSYQWEMMVTSPHSHAGVGVKRKRVYYYAWRALQRKRQATSHEEATVAGEDISSESEVEDGTYVHAYGRPWIPGAQLTDATIAEMMAEDSRRIVHEPYMKLDGHEETRATTGVGDGRSIDRVHATLPGWLAGRPERRARDDELVPLAELAAEARRSVADSRARHAQTSGRRLRSQAGAAEATKSQVTTASGEPWWESDWGAERVAVEQGFDITTSGDLGDRGLTEAEIAARQGGSAPPGWETIESSGRRVIRDPLNGTASGKEPATVSVPEAWRRYQRGMLSGVPADKWWASSAFGFLPTRGDLMSTQVAGMEDPVGMQVVRLSRPKGAMHTIYSICLLEQRAPSYGEYLRWRKYGEAGLDYSGDADVQSGGSDDDDGAAGGAATEERDVRLTTNAAGALVLAELGHAAKSWAAVATALRGAVTDSRPSERNQPVERRTALRAERRQVFRYRQGRLDMEMSDMHALDNIAIALRADPAVTHALGRMLGMAAGFRIVGVEEVVAKTTYHANGRPLPVAAQGPHVDHHALGKTVDVAIDIHGAPLGTFVMPNAFASSRTGAIDDRQPRGDCIGTKASMIVFDHGVVHGGPGLSVEDVEQHPGMVRTEQAAYITGRYFIRVCSAELSEHDLKKRNHPMTNNYFPYI